MPKLAEKFISDNGANIYDKVKITNKDQTFEGIIMPKNNFSGEHIIVIKLDNGYNIGVSTEGAEMNVIEKAKEIPMKELKIKKNKNLKDITVLGTGGTIASFVDYKTGAVSPAITAEQLVNSVSSLKEIANIEAEPLFSLASEKYIESQNSNNENIKATFEFITITGWVPSQDQPKPLKRGSAKMRLADALKVKEEKLKD